MTDCNHWLEPMLKATEAELENERRIREEESQNMRKAIREIKAIINGAERALGEQPDSFLASFLAERYQQEALGRAGHAALEQQSAFARMGGMRPSPYNSLFGLWLT